MPLPSDITANMISGLSISEPDLDTEIGSPTRKILDVVGEAISDAYLDSSLLNYQYDIDSKVGADLDTFCALFGIIRLPALRATGVATFLSSTPASSDQIIPLGTQLIAGTIPAVYYYTAVPGVIAAETSTIDIPIQAAVGGSNGNLPTGSLALISSPVDGGIVSVTNTEPISGGTDLENDNALRTRFKATVFRSLAGTEQQFIGTALTNPFVTRANIIGSSVLYREQIQILDGTATSSITEIVDAAYIFEDTVVLGPDIDNGAIMVNGVDYSFDATQIPPVITALQSYYTLPDGSSGAIEGGVYEIEFEYLPTSSRNDPNNGITNRIDLFVDGVNPVQASQTIALNTSVSRQFTAASSDVLNINNFLRDDMVTNPTSGNYFVPLAFGPLITLPSVINIDIYTYYQNEDYWLVKDETAGGYGFGSLAGIEWLSASLPAANSSVVLQYTYNTVPYDVAKSLENWRLVTTDVKVHQTHYLPLNVNIICIYDLGFVPSDVNNNIITNIQGYFNALSFGSVIQAIDVIEAARTATGVLDVRFVSAQDYGTVFSSSDGSTYSPIGGPPTQYAMQKVSPNGVIMETYQLNGRVVDISLQDNELPLLNALNVAQRSPNTFKGW